MSDSRTFAERYIDGLRGVIDGTSSADIASVLNVLVRAHREGRQVLILGNGGSAATASHMANDLLWGLTRAGIKPLRATALTENVAVMTAIANDEGYGSISRDSSRRWPHLEMSSSSSPRAATARTSSARSRQRGEWGS